MSTASDPVLKAIRDVERARRDFRRFVIGFALSMGILIATVTYDVLDYQPKTACQTDPAGRECQLLKVESDSYRTVHSACVITRIAGLGCPAADNDEGRP